MSTVQCLSYYHTPKFQWQGVSGEPVSRRVGTHGSPGALCVVTAARVGEGWRRPVSRGVPWRPVAYRGVRWRPGVSRGVPPPAVIESLPAATARLFSRELSNYMIHDARMDATRNRY